jgi:hypothetical protein
MRDYPVVPDTSPEFPEFRGSDPDCLPVRELGPARQDTIARQCCQARAPGTGPRRVPAFDPSLRSP